MSDFWYTIDRLAAWEEPSKIKALFRNFKSLATDITMAKFTNIYGGGVSRGYFKFQITAVICPLNHANDYNAVSVSKLSSSLSQHQSKHTTEFSYSMPEFVARIFFEGI